MLNFIYNNAEVINEIVYGLCGLVCILTAIKGLQNKQSRIGTFLFWGILGLLFMFGKVMIDNIPKGGSLVGALLMVLGVLTLTNQVKKADFAPLTKEEVEKNSKPVGNKIFIPAIAIGVIAMFMAQMKSFNISVGTNEAGKAIIFGFTTAQVMGISAVIALIIGLLITKPKARETIDDTTKLLMQVGTSSLLPQLLGALGSVFAAAGVGTLISNAASGVVPEGVPIVGVIVYCLGMVIFTMIMGNAFAAFTVITIGVGIPFVIAQGGDPAVVGALGMTCGYCGTLMTPMAANFNIVPAAILETKDKYRIIKTQVPMALALIVVHIVLMVTLAF